MRLNRGCGCVLLGLAFINLVFVVAAIYGVAAGETGAALGILALVVFGANLVASLLLGIAAIRGLPISARAPAEEAQEGGELAAEDEGEGSDEESDEE